MKELKISKEGNCNKTTAIQNLMLGNAKFLITYQVIKRLKFYTLN
jgi:hypothetical protein